MTHLEPLRLIGGLSVGLENQRVIGVRVIRVRPRFSLEEVAVLDPVRGEDAGQRPAARKNRAQGLAERVRAVEKMDSEHYAVKPAGCTTLISQLQKVLFTIALWFEPRSFVLIGFFSALTAKNFL